jgi:hypothetical protein
MLKYNIISYICLITILSNITKIGKYRYTEPFKIFAILTNIYAFHHKKRA